MKHSTYYAAQVWFWVIATLIAIFIVGALAYYAGGFSVEFK